MSQKIEAVIFDLGRVLIDVDFSRLFKNYIPQKERENYIFHLEEIMGLPWFQEFSTGQTTIKEFYRKVTDYFKIDIDLENFKREWSSIFRLMPGMDELVNKVATQMPVSLLSDTDAIHWEYLLAKYPFLTIFKRPVLSFEIGHLKPAEICYQKAAQSVNLPVDKCLFIDDREININGAKQVGMQAIQFKSYDTLKDILQEKYAINV